MVGETMMVNSRESLAGLIDSAKLASDLPSKLDRLLRLKHDLQLQDSDSVSVLLPPLFHLRSDHFAPVRKLAAEIFGEVGSKHVKFVPEIAAELIAVLDDATPAVARQAISCGSALFRRTLENVAIQGFHSGELNDSLTSAWESMLRFKEKIYTLAFQPGGGGIRLLALKFVVTVILLYTPDPNGSAEPPLKEENVMEFNVSWLRGGHPILNVGDLSLEASKNLVVLLDQLRLPAGNCLSYSTIIVLINSLSVIAKKRPAFYGRILPVLLGLVPPTSVINGIRIFGAHHALRNAFIACLNCTHPGAAPWRDRLNEALRKINDGGLAWADPPQYSNNNGERNALEYSLIAEKEQPTAEAFDANNNFSMKRSGSPDKDDDTPGKRLKATPSVSEDLAKGSDKAISVSQGDISLISTGPSTSKGVGDAGPVHQLVAMFRALVAQGEKATGSLEILISSISADLLAELVIVNMSNLPPDAPMAGDDETLLNVNIINSQAKYPPSFVATVLSLSTTFPKIASLLDNHPSASNDTMKRKREVELNADNAVISVDMDVATEDPLVSSGLSASSDVSSEMDKGGTIIIAPGIHDEENLESEIPGLDSTVQDDNLLTAATTLVSTGFDDASKDQSTSFCERSSLNLPTSVSTDMSEEFCPKEPASDANSLNFSTATSVGLSHPLVLPKMLAPVINLADDEKDDLQKSAFNRVIEAYKHISVSGGSQLRSSLLAHLGVEFPLELDPWNLIQKHILEDYVNHEGHELTLRILYRLYGEAEEDRDFFSSRAATSVYELFLLTVLETMRDSFPPSDKSLSRLLGEVPYLPNKVITFLEGMCSPEDSDKTEKEAQNGDRVTQGLSTMWSLILLRPAFRDACLKIVLKSTVHHMEEIRMKAIRLVANKLYPMTSIQQRIEEFAKETLLCVIKDGTTEKLDAEGLVRKDYCPEKQLNELQSTSVSSNDVLSDTHQSSTSQTVLSFSLSEAQRCMALYFALCTKKHSFFREVFVVYKCASRPVEQVVERHIPMLVRTMGSSTDLLEIISDPPVGSERLLMQVLHTLTDGAVPSQELIFAIKKLYDSKLKNIEILIPILPFISKDEVLLNFTQVVTLPGDKFQAALTRILQGSPHSGPLLAPAEVLIAIHGIDPEKDKIPLKQITDACNACFEQKHIFTQQVIAKVLNQLVEQIPLPVLFMRTVLQAIGAFPALADFAVEILSRLVNKQIWKYPKLWVGFLKCAFLTKPQSFGVLLQLPPAQLENALNRTAALKAPLITHASQPDIRSSLPRSTLVVLGIASDPQISSRPQTSQSQVAETPAADKEDVATERSKESSGTS